MRRGDRGLIQQAAARVATAHQEAQEAAKRAEALAEVEIDSRIRTAGAQTEAAIRQGRAARAEARSAEVEGIADEVAAISRYIDAVKAAVDATRPPRE
jgi:hypothetical protein